MMNLLFGSDASCYTGCLDFALSHTGFSKRWRVLDKPYDETVFKHGAYG